MSFSNLGAAGFLAGLAVIAGLLFLLQRLVGKRAAWPDSPTVVKAKALTVSFQKI